MVDRRSHTIRIVDCPPIDRNGRVGKSTRLHDYYIQLGQGGLTNFESVTIGGHLKLPNNPGTRDPFYEGLWSERVRIGLRPLSVVHFQTSTYGGRSAFCVPGVVFPKADFIYREK